MKKELMKTCLPSVTQPEVLGVCLQVFTYCVKASVSKMFLKFVRSDVSVITDDLQCTVHLLQEQHQINILKIVVSESMFVPGRAGSMGRCSWVNT